MKIIFHLGVHCTDEEQVLRCLRQNSESLAAQGIVVPDPAKYRSLLRDTATALETGSLSEEAQDILLDQLLDGHDDDPSRLVLAWDNLLSFPQWAVRGRFYPSAGTRVLNLARMFPNEEVTFRLAVRNPATWLPDLHARQKGKNFRELVSGLPIEKLRWSDMVEDMVTCSDNIRVTLWCDEDAPILWPRILASIGGVEDGTSLTGWTDFYAPLLDPHGLKNLGAVAALPMEEREAAISALLEAHGLPDAFNMTFEAPGWDQMTVDHLSALYEADVARIGALPGVTLLRP
ncbi:hypothetical protein [Falsirhodobacter algicola]|uniref:Uncharacterized protein n=1 Tax=Falsirhodobacter algicola TaxID=2692330 RepID=A0A8J8MRQ6_9RHOB|nr:hypothetical protein [Falsirhodobacter algicola]QUS35537.1 hypothetical protein GR316_04165 [Falsirhodobacter algicola]